MPICDTAQRDRVYIRMIHERVSNIPITGSAGAKAPGKEEIANAATSAEDLRGKGVREQGAKRCDANLCRERDTSDHMFGSM